MEEGVVRTIIQNIVPICIASRIALGQWYIQRTKNTRDDEVGGVPVEAQVKASGEVPV